jgi:hypothetical protein
VIRRITVSLTTLVALGCATGVAQQPRAEAAPSLVVLITIDQFRPDYYDRWGQQFTGGLGRLAREGAFFTEAAHDHAITETAPGHASIGTGSFPVHNGIASNFAGVVDPSVTLVDETGIGASPFRLESTGFADWLVRQRADARVVSISTKDRGAILPAGHVRGHVYWYAPSGRFTTSTYYRQALPDWVRRFNDLRLPQSWAGRTWNLLLEESAYPEPDSIPFERNGTDFLFPHVLPQDSVIAPQLLPIFPWIDDLTLGLSLQAVRELRLGTGSGTDFLSISLCGADYIGHSYGPDSRELHDQVLRLDRALGAFLDTLFTLVDHRRVAIALSADHGVAPIPELHGGNASRVSVAPFVSHMRAALRHAGVDTTAFSLGSGALAVDRGALRAAGVDVDSVLRGFVAFARSVPGVRSADFLTELAQRDTVTDHVARRWLHMFAPGGDVQVVATLEPYSIWSYGAVATHGSPWDYDARVPLIFWGQAFAPGRYATPARTVDIAPTLAQALGLVPSERVDGRVLNEALR